MHALITGGEGYIGTHLAYNLLKAGHKVTTLDSKFNPSDAVIEGMAQYNSKLRRFEASINNIDRLQAAMQGVDIIYHLAARTDDSTNYRHIIRMTNTNVVGMSNVIAMARKSGIDRIVYASTAAVYGNLVGAQEMDKPNPINAYGASKLAAEHLLTSAFHTGLNVVILRLYNVWGGPGSRSVVRRFNEGYITIHDDGMQTRDFVYIGDVIEALINASLWDSNVYNIGSGEETTINGLFHILNPGIKPVYKASDTVGIYRSVADISFTHKTVGWLPTVLMSNLTVEQLRLLA